MTNLKNARDMFGDKEGEYIHFTFYAERNNKSPIAPEDAYELQFLLIAWLKERGFGFDGSAQIGVWKQ